ncbi:MAG: hypothetical protein ABSG44_02975 [Thermodesulfobacteriota bacterium]|jgi:hypothetical protein
MTRKISLTFMEELVVSLPGKNDPENGKELQIIRLGLRPDEKRAYI